MKIYKIFVIENDPKDFAMVRAFLMEKFFNPRISHATNFLEAIPDLTSIKCSFDVVLLDLPLHDKTGYDALPGILLLASSCPLIILTGAGNIEFSIRSIGLGVADYLIKDDLNATSLYKSIIYSIERKRNMKELMQSEKRYSDLFYSSPHPMWVYDPETFKFIQVNKAAVKYYGYSEKEFLNMTTKEIALNESPIKTKPKLEIQKKTTDVFTKEKVTQFKKSGEEIEVEVYSTAINVKNKIFNSVIAIDVTEKNLYARKLIKAIINAQENERYEIGGELHDNVCQILAASQITLGILKECIPPSNMKLFEKCTDSLNLALYEIRNLSHRLAPSFFDNSTLEAAFRNLFTTYPLENMEIMLFFDTAVKKIKINLELRLNLYRILQEQLRNIFKHSNATLIEVFVSINNKKLKMRIIDNGIGFDSDTIKWGIGLSNMKRRAELFLGTFEIDSSQGKGCKIGVNIPLQEIY